MHTDPPDIIVLVVDLSTDRRWRLVTVPYCPASVALPCYYDNRQDAVGYQGDCGRQDVNTAVDVFVIGRQQTAVEYSLILINIHDSGNPWVTGWLSR